MQMRRQEEKERTKQENEDKKKAADKSFKVSACLRGAVKFYMFFFRYLKKGFTYIHIHLMRRSISGAFLTHKVAAKFNETADRQIIIPIN